MTKFKLFITSTLFLMLVSILVIATMVQYAQVPFVNSATEIVEEAVDVNANSSSPPNEDIISPQPIVKPKQSSGGGGGSNEASPPQSNKPSLIIPTYYNFKGEVPVLIISYESNLNLTDQINALQNATGINYVIYDTIIREGNARDRYDVNNTDFCHIDLHNQTDCQPDYRLMLDFGENETTACELVDSGLVKEFWFFNIRKAPGGHEFDVIASNMAMGYNIQDYWNYETFGDISYTNHLLYNVTDDMPICNKTYTVYHFDINNVDILRFTITDVHIEHFRLILEWLENQTINFKPFKIDDYLK